MCVLTTPKSSDYIRTYSGIKFWPLEPKTKDIQPIDIAHSLAQKVRWQGHCKDFYTVGQHSLRVARAASIYANLRGEFSDTEEDVIFMYGLLHDANEAYLPDVPSPLKPLIKGWKRIEKKVDNIILKRFGLPPIIEEYRVIVKTADRALLQMESDEFFPKATKHYSRWPLPERMDIPDVVLEQTHVSLFPVDTTKDRLLTEMKTIIKLMC